jgi:hypothetical protein
MQVIIKFEYNLKSNVVLINIVNMASNLVYKHRLKYLFAQ